jgi:RNA-directed DNA polymerase
MKILIDLSASEANNFLLKAESYINFELPVYFKFQDMLNAVGAELNGKLLSDNRESNPRDYDDINYKLLTNKDGKYAWRPFQIIHPAIYVSLVNKITEEANWATIIDRFKLFRSNDRIECHSVPVVSESEVKSEKNTQIYTWWQMVEQRSIALAIDYKYMLQTDISDCYGSIYTHSIPWAIHTKEEAKKRENRNRNNLIGVAIDNHLQDMSYGQTNGIPQGGTLMDFIAEMVLGYVDSLLTERIHKLSIIDYRILRYRDDYRIFTNNPFESDQITKALSEILTEMGLKLNAEKTEASDDVIKTSLKPDKRYWIVNKRVTENKQKWLIQLYLLSEQFPNSGTLFNQMREFLRVLQTSERKDPNIHTLISLVVEIAYRNPRVAPTAIAILTFLINQIADAVEKQDTVNRIKSKFSQIPNSGLLKVWLQRLFLKIDNTIIYEEGLCQKVVSPDTRIWNTEWLNGKLRGIIEGIPIVDYAAIEALEEVATEEEIEEMATKNEYAYYDL